MKSWFASIGSSMGCGFTALCCLGAPAVVSILSAVGLGFIRNDAILAPLMVVFLGINLGAIHISSKRHERREVLYLAAVGAALAFSGFWFSTILLGIGIAGIFLATGLDVYFTKICKAGCMTIG